MMKCGNQLVEVLIGINNKMTKQKKQQKKKKKEKEKHKGTINKYVLLILSLALGIFFVLPHFHSWANNQIIRLHFCDHFACIVFSIIFFAFFVVSAFYILQRRKKRRKKGTIKRQSLIWWVPFIIILVVGIILMNITYCDSEGMHFGEFFPGVFGAGGIARVDACKPGVNCPVPIPPCEEDDDGRDYISFGSILSGANVDDICMGDILRERYCNSETTYTSEDIDCTTLLTNGTCIEGECREGEVVIAADDEEERIETDCGDGVDNDDDGFFDCADSDCDYAWLDGGCGDFDYSCEHNPTTPYPFCGGTCPSGEVCADYAIETGSWCTCMPEGEIPCSESTGEGWCEEDYECDDIDDEFFCVYDFGDCYDTDGGIDYLVGGFSVEENPIFGTLNYIEYCGWLKGDTNTIYEYYCLEGVATPIEINCETLGFCCIEDTVFGSYCAECEL